MRKAVAWVSIFIGAVGIATAEAFPIRVQFQVTTTSGPLAGQTAKGTSRSSDGGSTHASWGWPAGNDLPLPADYDADGKADITIYRGTTGEWFTLRSSDGGLTHTTWGTPASSRLGDVTVPAKFTIRRPLRSTTAADTGPHP